MTDQELARYIKIFALTHPEYEMGGVCPIPKKDLKVGHIYLGDCRNADKAVWIGEKFEYQRDRTTGDIFQREVKGNGKGGTSFKPVNGNKATKLAEKFEHRFLKNLDVPRFSSLKLIHYF